MLSRGDEPVDLLGQGVTYVMPMTQKEICLSEQRL